jgi:threonine dehydratase
VFGVNTIADGIAMKQPGKLTMPLVKKYVDDIVLVDEEEIEAAVLLLLEVEKTVAEGSAAVGLAALMQNKKAFEDKKVGIIISGGNIDMPVLQSIIARGLVRSHRMTRIRVGLRDVPGTLASATQCIEDSGANIVHVHHHRNFTELPLQIVEVEFILQTRGKEHVQEVIERLQKNQFKVRSLY